MSAPHKTPENAGAGGTSNAAGATGNKDQAGPDRMSPELDNAGKWDEVAADDGFQQGDQGGYKGSYDETKYQAVQDRDMNLGYPRGDSAGGKGDDDGKKTPMKQDSRTQDIRSDEAEDNKS